MGVRWYVAYPLSIRHVEERAVHAHRHRAAADDQETTALKHLPALFLGGTGTFVGIFLGGLLLCS